MYGVLGAKVGHVTPFGAEQTVGFTPEATATRSFLGTACKVPEVASGPGGKLHCLRPHSGRLGAVCLSPAQPGLVTISPKPGPGAVAWDPILNLPPQLHRWSFQPAAT